MAANSMPPFTLKVPRASADVAWGTRTVESAEEGEKHLVAHLTWALPLDIAEAQMEQNLSQLLGS